MEENACSPDDGGIAVSVTAIQKARREAVLAEAIGLKLDEWGEDPYEDGAVISMYVKFEEDGPEYAYVYLRAGDRWYSTAAMGRGRSVSWDDVVAFAVEHDLTPSDCYEVTGWRPLA